jgi:hypothetical protein
VSKALSLLLSVAILTPLLLAGCAEVSKSITAAKTNHAHPSCKLSRAKCKEYERAEKANKQETVGLRLLREDCEGYRKVCSAEVDMAVQGYP